MNNAIPSSGPISMSMFNEEVGKPVSAANSLLAGDTTPTTGSLFWLGNQTSSLNQAAPHAMSEWYSWNAKCLTGGLYVIKNDTASTRILTKIIIPGNNCIGEINYGSTYGPGGGVSFGPPIKGGTNTFSWQSTQTYDVSVEGSTDNVTYPDVYLVFTVNNNTYNGSIFVPNANKYLRWRIIS